MKICMHKKVDHDFVFIVMRNLKPQTVTNREGNKLEALCAPISNLYANEHFYLCTNQQSICKWELLCRHWADSYLLVYYVGGMLSAKSSWDIVYLVLMN